MNTETGEIKQIADLKREPDFIGPKKGSHKLWAKGCWWVVTKKEPTLNQKQHGIKGHHLCLCGSGKKFRKCCRVFKPKGV